MRADLRDYYERELQYFRESAVEFAAKYPKIASRLVLGEKDNPDPHVERLIEGAAFLAARVHLKIDDDFPEITDALLNIVYPHYLRPIPSMTMAEFQLDPQQGKLTTGLKIPRDSTLYSRPVAGMACKFRTCYDTTLWPVTVSAADWRSPDKIDPPVRGGGAVAVVRMELRCAAELTFDKLALNTLRFYLRGDPNVVQSLYEVMLSNCTQVLVRDPKNPRKTPLKLPAGSLRPSGFDEDQSVLPYPKRSFDGYRLLHEYFAFPQKFLFLELAGLEALAPAGFQESVEVLFFISSFDREDRWQTLELGTRADTFRLGCTPAVNLFSQTAEPILLKHTEYEYPVVPDARRRTIEVFSIDDVVSTAPDSSEVVRYAPFFSFRHSDENSRRQAFWYAQRRDGTSDRGPGLYLTLVDLSGRKFVPDVEAITARLTCCNGDLPSRLPFGSEAGDFELEGGGPIKAVRALERPTPSINPKTESAAFWRLISHLALNQLSLVSEGREALQEILQLYNFTDAPAATRQIQAIRQLEARPHFARLVSEHGITFARGYLVEMNIDEEEFAGAGAFLFASVLERFLGMYASLNSFSQLVVRTPQRKEVLRRWPPRAGRRILM